MSSYNIVTETADTTVVVEYKPIKLKLKSYQSEAQLEAQFIKMLTEQGYEYVNIHDEDTLIKNLRKRLEILNEYNFTDNEWDYFFKNNIANLNWHMKEKAKIIQEDYRQVLKRDNGESKNIALIAKDNIYNNYLQVIHQYEAPEGRHSNRYDVTILVNGFPLIHIELKRRGVLLKEAFNQINRYERESFWSGSGLYEYVQIFVISNGTNTKYYSNTTRWNHVHGKSQKSMTSNSFEFTSFWADAKNTIIPDLMDFTRTFFAKHTILNILTRYCVFTSENDLLVMRPYQIAATEKILSKINISQENKQYGTIKGSGYVWHTTGSGKTLTSFKTARLATAIPGIDKVIFVVDRKDLDYQTMREYDKFEKGAANSNVSTEILKKQLESHEAKIIITTIQKLSCFINKYFAHDIYKKRIVFIFDECHRSQFGEMHNKIIKHFKKYNLFGFTGTPIFAANAGSGANLKTTEQVFGERLHTYTIVDAINDHNVLPFKVDYIKTMSKADNIEDEEVYDIDRDNAYLAPERISLVTKYILDHFQQKTYRNNNVFYYHSVITNIAEVIKGRRYGIIKEIKKRQAIHGFNSIFAVSKIVFAQKYYSEFKKQMNENPEKSIKVGLIYSYQANEEAMEGILGEENSDNTDGLQQSDRDFLESAIQDYNKMFDTAYDTSAEKFSNYYKDISLRMKNKELDLLIVVDMFLTGFNATTLNTLWVDKKLRMHGLLQAYSRTNRILNSIKNFGNIVCFRNLQRKTDEAIALFGDEDAKGIIILKGFNDYYEGYDDSDGTHKKGYVELIAELKRDYPIGKQITGDNSKKTFINLFSQILRVRNILSSFDSFAGKEILAEMDFQDYQSMYYDTWEELKGSIAEKEDILNDIVFEAELAKSIEINIDYILLLVEKYHATHCQDEKIRLQIRKAVNSSGQLRSKKELIENFINGINDVDDIYEEWKHFLAEKQNKEMDDIIRSENLKPQETKKFIKRCFDNGEVKVIGTEITGILPPISRFGQSNYREKKLRVIEKITAFFEKFFGF